MSIRSHYSRDSYLNRPLTNGGSRRKSVTSPIPKEAMAPEIDEELSVDCKRCPYKRLVDKALIETEDESANQQQRPVATIINNPRDPLPQPIDNKPKSLFKRFGDYVAKNQAANKAAGDTSLTEDLMSFGKTYGKGLSDGAARVANEELSKIDKQKSVQKSDKEDDELIDFLSGKKKRK